MSTFIAVWRYKVKAGKETEFEKLYGQNGDWVRLFRKFPGYIRTDLIKDLNDESVYLTLDYWKNKEAYSGFKVGSRTEYAKKDKKGEELTAEENHIGDFIFP